MQVMSVHVLYFFVRDLETTFDCDLMMLLMRYFIIDTHFLWFCGTLEKEYIYCVYIICMAVIYLR